MKITILGSGTCVPSLQRRPSAAMVTHGDLHILVDCGPGTMHRMLEAGVTIFEIDAVCLTHFHPDHSGELAAFLFARKYSPSSTRKSALKLVGGPGLKAFYQRLKAVYGQWLDSEDHPVELAEQHPIGTSVLQLGTTQLATGEVAHNPESVALRITDANGASLVYSGDTDMSESLVNFATGADLLVCEAAMPDGQKVAGHLTPSLAGDIAARARVRKLMLTHFYPPCDEVDMVAQCRQTWSGELHLASDLMSLSIDPAPGLAKGLK